MKTNIWLALSAFIVTSLLAPPIMGMGQEKEKGEYLATQSARKESRSEISATRRTAREEYQAKKNALISQRKEIRKETSASRISKRETA